MNPIPQCEGLTGDAYLDCKKTTLLSTTIDHTLNRIDFISNATFGSSSEIFSNSEEVGLKEE